MTGSPLHRLSGAGKTTPVRMLLENDPLIRLSISTTTRSPRPGEVDGREYCFVDVPTFLERVNQGEASNGRRRAR